MKSISQTLITGVYRSGSEYLTHLINLHPDIAATMYRVNILIFFYKQYDPIFLKENYLLALNNLNLRLKKRYDIKVDIKKISNYIKNNI